MSNVGGDTSKLLSANANFSENNAPLRSSTPIVTPTALVATSSPALNNVQNVSPFVSVNSQLKTGYYNAAGPSNPSISVLPSNSPNNSADIAHSVAMATKNQNKQQQQSTLKKPAKIADDSSSIWCDLSMDIRPSPSSSTITLDFHRNNIEDDSMDIDESDEIGIGGAAVASVGNHGNGGSRPPSSLIKVKILRNSLVKKGRSCCCCCCSPLCQWASIKTFCFLICMLITVHGALATGYTYSVLTTIEKRFSVNSVIAGFVISSYELGSLLSVVFVSYFGTHGHIPRWIGLGGLVLCAGSFLFSVPHFVAPDYKPPNVNDSGAAVCDLGGPAGSVLKRQIEPMSLPNSLNDNNDLSTKFVCILIFAQILLGAGGSPMFTLGTAYIDNHVEKENAAVYLAFMYVMMAVGPVCGFLLGALLLGEYVDPYKVPPKMESGSPYWVGLWWGGYIICGGLYLVSSFPFFFFPRRLSTSKELSDKESEYGRSWRKIPLSVFNLLTNGVYIVATLNACIELAIVSGFTTFLPKYIETQFNLSPSFSSGLTGVVAVPGACFGIFFGSWMIKHFKMEMKGVAKLVLVVNCLSMGMLTLFFVFGCKNIQVAGLTVPYNESKSLTEVNLTDVCNSRCSCNDRSDYSPVCGTNMVTYVSPCHAGCAISLPTGKQRKNIVGDVTWETHNYTGCSCFTTNFTKPGAAKEGMCVSDCKMLVPFLILLFLVSLAASNNQMPLVLVTLRSVAEEEKAFALGVQLVVLRLLSYIPSPIIYGAAIDSSCLLKSTGFNRHDHASCLMYDVEKFRLRFSSVSMSFMVVAFALSLVLWWCINKRYTPFSPPVTMSEIAHRLGDIENLHIRRSTTANSLRSWVSDDSLYSRPRSPRHQKTRSC